MSTILDCVINGAKVSGVVAMTIAVCAPTWLITIVAIRATLSAEHEQEFEDRTLIDIFVSVISIGCKIVIYCAMFDNAPRNGHGDSFFWILVQTNVTYLALVAPAYLAFWIGYGCWKYGDRACRAVVKAVVDCWDLMRMVERQNVLADDRERLLKPEDRTRLMAETSSTYGCSHCHATSE